MSKTSQSTLLNHQAHSFQHLWAVHCSLFPSTINIITITKVKVNRNSTAKYDHLYCGVGIVSEWSLTSHTTYDRLISLGNWLATVNVIYSWYGSVVLVRPTNGYRTKWGHQAFVGVGINKMNILRVMVEHNRQILVDWHQFAEWILLDQFPRSMIRQNVTKSPVRVVRPDYAGRSFHPRLQVMAEYLPTQVAETVNGWQRMSQCASSTFPIGIGMVWYSRV